MNEGRKEIIQIAFVVVGIIFLIKLFFIQVVDRKYKDMAESNAILKVVDPPERGLIYDRNGKLIVYNTPKFILKVLEHFLTEVIDTEAIISSINRPKQS